MIIRQLCACLWKFLQLPVALLMGANFTVQHHRDRLLGDRVRRDHLISVSCYVPDTKAATVVYNTKSKTKEHSEKSVHVPQHAGIDLMAQFQGLLPIPTARRDVSQAHTHYLKATAKKNRLLLRGGKKKSFILFYC